MALLLADLDKVELCVKYLESIIQGSGDRR